MTIPTSGWLRDEHTGMDGEPITAAQADALVRDIDRRRIGLDTVTTPDGTELTISTVFLVQPTAITEMLGGPYETLVETQDGAEVLRPKWRDRAAATDGHRTIRRILTVSPLADLLLAEPLRDPDDDADDHGPGDAAGGDAG